MPEVARGSHRAYVLPYSFVRHKLLNYWLSDLEVYSENLLTEDTYLKDYDALVGLTLGTSDLQCAIEYERSTKSVARYVDIRRQLAQETIVHAVIYIVKGIERILSIVEQLAPPPPEFSLLPPAHFFALDQTRMRCTRLLQEVRCGSI